MYDIYIVKENDTIEEIAKRFGISIYDILVLNNLENSYSLMPNMQLKIPVTSGVSFTSYTVKDGDNIYKIAADYNTRPEYLLLVNGLNGGEYIYPGEQILVPKEGVEIYVTKPGDTISSIANSLAENVNDILVYNSRLFLIPDQLVIYKTKQ